MNIYSSKKSIQFKPALMAGVVLAIAAPFASGATVLAAFDTRTDSISATNTLLDRANPASIGVGPLATGRDWRSYLTFDLTSESLAAGAVTLDLDSFGSATSIDTFGTQEWSLFELAADWHGATYGGGDAGPDGTEFQTFDVTMTSAGVGAITISGSGLTAKYNLAVGGLWHVGIKSALEGTGNRAYSVFADTGKDGDPNGGGTYTGPTLTYTAVPEPSSTALLGIFGIFGLALRRRR